METGKLVISLDFELLWGIFDKVDPKEKKVYFHNTREVIPGILDLFREYQISCTWAVVGMLFNKDWNQWSLNTPSELPQYVNHQLSPYRFGQLIQGEETAFLCFAPEIIDKIKNTPRQEVATHTYSHYYCSENGQTASTFKADMEQAVRLAKAVGIELRSLVFPRNQLNDEYLEICHEMGITSVRSNPSNWYWKDTQESSLAKRIFRTSDAYLGLNNKSYPVSALKKQPARPLEQKASRLLRPYSGNKLLNSLKLKRIRSEMKTAAKRKEVYHLWWHPHNFGDHPRESLADLRKLLQYYQGLRDQYGFGSATMADIHDDLLYGDKKLI